MSDEPDSYSRHEALHMAHVFGEMICTYLLEHRAIKANPEWEALAEKASQALFDLYQAIGRAHLDDA